MESSKPNKRGKSCYSLISRKSKSPTDASVRKLNKRYGSWRIVRQSIEVENHDRHKLNLLRFLQFLNWTLVIKISIFSLVSASVCTSANQNKTPSFPFVTWHHCNRHRSSIFYFNFWISENLDKALTMWRNVERKIKEEESDPKQIPSRPEIAKCYFTR